MPRCCGLHDLRPFALAQWSWMLTHSDKDPTPVTCQWCKHKLLGLQYDRQKRLCGLVSWIDVVCFVCASAYVFKQSANIKRDSFTGHTRLFPPRSSSLMFDPSLVWDDSSSSTPSQTQTVDPTELTSTSEIWWVVAELFLAALRKYAGNYWITVSDIFTALVIPVLSCHLWHFTDSNTFCGC